MPPNASRIRPAVTVMRTARRAAFALAALLSAYLAVVAIWAFASVGKLVTDDTIAARDAPLSAQQVAILLKIEDPDFFTHRGLSLADGQGFATLTSALAPPVFLSGPRLGGIEGVLQAFYRRVFDCCKKIDLGRDVMALVLDAHLSKQRQLATYVATVYMGTNQAVQVKGLEQASLSYLGKPLAHISDQEFAGLVAMIKAPNYFHPRRNRAAYAARLAKVQAVIAGRCTPGGWFDTDYRHCTP